jgi:hypothetical protein
MLGVVIASGASHQVRLVIYVSSMVVIGGGVLVVLMDCGSGGGLAVHEALRRADFLQNLARCVEPESPRM